MTKRPYDPEIKAEIESILADRAKAEAEEEVTHCEEEQRKEQCEEHEVLGRSALIPMTIII